MRHYKAGACFGERNLLRTEPRHARMTCRDAAKLLRLSAETFVACARITEAKEKLAKQNVARKFAEDQAQLAAARARQAEDELVELQGELGDTDPTPVPRVLRRTDHGTPLSANQR